MCLFSKFFLKESILTSDSDVTVMFWAHLPNFMILVTFTNLYIPWFGDTTVAHTVWPTRKKKRNKTKMIGN